MAAESSPSQWLDLDVGDTHWRVERSFLESNWSCIWNRGCAGIEQDAAPDDQLGCCSVGAQMLDDDEAMLISALGAMLDPEYAQFADVIGEHGALTDDRSNTRTVDGACVFLNRPGFPGGAGCALHGEAERVGESYIDWKPSICWQLPLKIEQSEPRSGAAVSTLRSWSRADWGPDGEAMAYCCTERDDAVANAYVGDQPVVESLREELVALLGDDVVDAIAERLAP